MNGYGVQLGVTMTGIKETVFPVNIALGDTLVVHNYHQMDALIRQELTCTYLRPSNVLRRNRTSLNLASISTMPAT